MQIKIVAALLVLTAAAPQAAHKLERVPPEALLAEGRVVESAPGLLVLEYQDVRVGGETGMAVERTSLDLREAQGYVYFVRQDREAELGQGLRDLPDGAWVELAPMPEHEFRKWRVQGTTAYTDPVIPGRTDALLRRKPTVHHLGVGGWLYVWVVAEPPSGSR